tara:strand:+ start:5242 stop:6267 length:1026 start_codon:yes stop_codon:yes gene_type:complete
MGFKRLDAEDFLVSADAVTSTVWTGNSPGLSNFYYSTAQSGDRSGDYYLAVYQSTPSSAGAEVQFDIAFADSTGRGSLAFNSDVSNVLSPSRTIYGQYRTLLLEDENAKFKFGGVEQNHFYAISINRARYKEKLLPGSFNLTLTNGGLSISLTDNSKDVTLPTYYGAQRAYEIVVGQDGSATTGLGYAGAGGAAGSLGSYGLFFPDTSTILLNGAALDNATYGIDLNTTLTANTDAENNKKLFTVIDNGSSFRLNSEETITSDFVFIRARNSEFNYSENPSFISGSTGEVVHNYFINNPQVYPTTVGLYNDSNELVATAKLSRPIQKDFTKEALIRIKLDF